MANPEIVDNDNLQLEVFNPIFKDAVVKFVGIATYAVGVIMALLKVSAGAVTPDGGNTGDGTVTALALAAGETPLPGSYNLECTFAVAEGGVFKLEDPNGELVADNLTLRVGAGLASSFVAGGLSFTITEGATDFVAGDKFGLAVTDEGGKWVPWVEDALDGSGEAVGVMPESVTSTGAGDLNRRMLVGGEVSALKLSVQAGGSVPAKAIEQLRDFTIHSVDGVRLDILDNQ